MARALPLRGVNRTTRGQPLPERAALRTARRFVRDRRGAIGLACVAVFVLAAIAAPVIAPFDPLAQNSGDELLPPGIPYLLGTDDIGRDIFSRLLFGARLSLTIAVGSALIGLIVGGASGLIAGYFGRWVDAIINRVWDALLAFPPILLGIALVLVIGAGAMNAAIAVGILNLPVFARLARASAITEKQRDYIVAARALGASDLRIISQHLLPNAAPSLLVQTSVAMAVAILLEASLSFLGLGVQAPAPSWGSMLSDSRQFLRVAPWYGIAPGAALTLLLIGLTLCSDTLRDVLDPRRLITVGRRD